MTTFMMVFYQILYLKHVALSFDSFGFTSPGFALNGPLQVGVVGTLCRSNFNCAGAWYCLTHTTVGLLHSMKFI